MKLRINLRGDAAYLLPRWRYISDKEKSGLYERVQDALHLHYGELRIGDFFDCIRCDFSVIGVCSTWNNATQAQYIWAMGFADYMENFSKMLERMTLRGTAEQQQAQMVCLRVGFEESVLVFLQDFFGLHSFKEAEDITVNEYLIAKKSAYNKAAFERKLNDIYKLKQKTKK